MATNETRDTVMAGLLKLAGEYSDAGMQDEVECLLAAFKLLQRARDEEEEEEQGEERGVA